MKALAKIHPLGGPVLAAVVRDVYRYLNRPGVETEIDNGVRAGLEGQGECVVVGHSLGAIVAYNLLRRRDTDADWTVPSFITVGCPLAIEPVLDALTPISRPAGVTDWLNAFDKQDIVALHPLATPYFGVTPPVDNYADVDNFTPNHHGIIGYLSNPTVASRIHDALTH